LIDSYLDMFKDYNMDCLKICLNSPLISLESINDTLYKYTQNSKYTLSHQFALWNKEFLMKNVYPFESPWQNEIYGSDRINESEHNIYYIDNNWYEPVCRQGTLQPIGYEILKKHNLSFYGK